MGEKQKDLEILLEEAFYSEKEDILLGTPVKGWFRILRRKAKGLLYCVDSETGETGVLLGERSEDEDTHQGDPDPLGGALLIGEPSEVGFLREATGEAKGIKIFNFRFLETAFRSRDFTRGKSRLTIDTFTDIGVGNIQASESGIMPGLNDQGVFEHSAFGVVSDESFQELEDVRRKYKEAHARLIAMGSPLVQELHEQAVEVFIPSEWRETKW